MKKIDKKLFSDVAQKKIKAEKVFKNVKVLNVFTEEIEETDVAVQNGIIIGLGSYEGIEEYDLSGKWIVPSFIDSHLHLESTLVRPSEFIKEASKSGTTTFVVDPHEAANVSGLDGIDYILQETENVSGDVYVMIPSCVPATNFEDSGSILYAKDMEKYKSHPRVLGLAEVMDTNAVLSFDENMVDKLEMFADMNIDGHAPALTDEELNAYVLAGVRTDHEATSYEYAKKEIERGMYVFIREGSAAKNLEAIVSGIVCENANTEYYCYCTDDKHIEDIQKEGHISYNIKKSIELGLNPVKAYKMASINAAKCIGKEKTLGAIASGYVANFVVLDDFEKVVINDVYYKGEKVSDILSAIDNSGVDNSRVDEELLARLMKTVNIHDVSTDDIRLIVDNYKEFPVANVISGQIVTKKTIEEIPVKGNEFIANEEYNKIVVVERHKKTGKVGVGVIKGFGIKNGAIASTVAHDSHNIVVIGDNDTDILLAIKELEKVQGGYTLFENGNLVDTLPLQIMGLISTQSHEEVNEKVKYMIEYSHKMGVKQDIDPFINLSFMALPVIPEIRVTARGIFDVFANKFLK